MTDAIRQVVSGQLGRVLNSGLSSVKSGLLGNKGRNSAPGGAMQSRGKYTTNVLQYPMGVDNDPQQGHYILFNINTNKQPKLHKEKTSSPASTLNRVKKEFNISDAVTGVDTFGGANPTGVLNQVDTFDVIPKITGIQTTSPNVSGASQQAAIKGSKIKSSYSKMINASTRLSTSIALYMPPQVQVSYTPNYTDVPVGGVAGAISGLYSSISKVIKDEGSVTDSDIRGILGNAEDAIMKGAYNTMDTFAPGIKALAQIQAGQILGNKMELSFEGVGRREFNYTFVFIPKSEQEAKVVDEIVNMFKEHSMPEYTGTTGRNFTIPDTFEIEYMYRGARNNFLNKISTCFCNGVQVSYGGDRWYAYDETQGVHGSGTPPQRTTLTLSFKEMEIITRERIAEGY